MPREREVPGQQLLADHLVQGVVTPDVLADRHERFRPR